MTWHTQHHWSEAEELRAAQLWAEGKSATRVAEAVNAEFGSTHTRNAVIGLKSRRAWPRHGDNKVRYTAAPVPRPPSPVRSHHKPHPPAAPAEVVSSLEPLPGVVPVGFFDLADGACRWVFDGDLYCGAPAAGSYCATHSVLVYGRVKRDFQAPKFRPSGLRFR